jgi:hypothetical protein
VRDRVGGVHHGEAPGVPRRHAQWERWDAKATPMSCEGGPGCGSMVPMCMLILCMRLLQCDSRRG